MPPCIAYYQPDERLESLRFSILKFRKYNI